MAIFGINEWLPFCKKDIFFTEWKPFIVFMKSEYELVLGTTGFKTERCLFLFIALIKSKCLHMSLGDIT